MSPLDAIFRSHHGRVMASLIRVLGDWQLAEDALMDACERALSTWPKTGTPDDPMAWLLTTARRSGIDRFRRQSTRTRHADAVTSALVQAAEERQEAPVQRDDDALRLMFTCCHPTLGRPAQVALTLRVVGGLTTPEIARAFQVPVPTMAQRLVRAKRKIHAAAIPFRIPEPAERATRLGAVLDVLYLVFNEGYATTEGEQLLRADLCHEAIRLATLLCDVADDAEAHGLLALMLFHDARASSRVDEHGDIVLLEDQDRSTWDQRRIRDAHERLITVLPRGPVGPYQLQACIAGCHARAATFEDTDWPQIRRLYDALLTVHPTPAVHLNRAVAIGFSDGWLAGLAAVDPLLTQLPEHHLFHAARADMLRRLDRIEDARDAYRTALQHVQQRAERAYLQRRLDALPPP